MSEAKIRARLDAESGRPCSVYEGIEVLLAALESARAEALRYREALEEIAVAGPLETCLLCVACVKEHEPDCIVGKALAPPEGEGSQT